MVNYLKDKKEVEEIIFPFDKDFPQYLLAKKQMQGSGGLFSFSLKAKNIRQIENFWRESSAYTYGCKLGWLRVVAHPGCASIPGMSLILEIEFTGGKNVCWFGRS